MSGSTTDKEPADLVVAGARVLPMAGPLEIIPDGALAVVGRRIAAVGATSEVLASFEPRRLIEAGGGIVHPGFVDCHAHTTYQLLRAGFGDTASYDALLEPYYAYLNAVDDADEYAAALLACTEMVMNGTTCFLEAGTAHSPAAVAAAAEAVGMRGLVGDPFLADMTDHGRLRLDRAPATRKRALSVLGSELQRNRDPHALVRGHVVLQGMGSASDELERAAKDLADEAGTVLNQHQSYAEADAAADDARRGRHPLVHFEELGILGSNCVFAHMNIVRDDEMRPIEDSGMSIAWCPAASMLWGVGGTLRGRHAVLYRRGINLALGSDSSNFANRFDLQVQAYLAVLTAREASGNRHALVADDGIVMATRNGARAVGLEHEIGSLEPGKRADFVLRSVDVPEAYPMFDASAEMLYATRSKNVHSVVIDGQIVVDARRPTRANLQEVLQTASSAARRVFSRMGYRPPTGSL